MDQPSPHEIASRIAEAGREWSEKECAAQMLEETRRSVRAQIASEHISDLGSVAKAELLAEASAKYREHIKAMVEARKQANIAKVNYDTGKLWTDLVRTREASERAAMQMR